MRVVAVAALNVGLVLGLLGAGCSRPVAPEPFGEFSVSRSGGVAGLRDVLRVRPDGVAVVTSPAPRAGRLSADRMARARRVLESDELRREVAAARTRARPAPRCADLLSRGFTMGSLALSVTEPCGDERNDPTPALDELLTVVEDATGGTFDEPLAPGDLPVLTVRVLQPGRTLVLPPGGRVTLARPGEPSRDADLTADRYAGLALTAEGLLGTAPTPCGGTSTPTVEIVRADGRRAVGSACGFGARAPDAYTLVLVLSQLFPR